MDHCINSYQHYRIKFVVKTCGWSFSAKSYHDPTTQKFWKWVSFVVLFFCRCRL